MRLNELKVRLSAKVCLYINDRYREKSSASKLILARIELHSQCLVRFLDDYCFVAIVNISFMASS